ncbi:hypothetical protein C4D60_Mb01t00520 [Musa balbisiana]|uniref:Uncharacterized protein n=1 Tax=Musa balbisiana TaxID=52838 RepID=A0A4S8JK41_MUSBA|nr:hypothetical protein C4D60_Mb01t00520 [Musa balbisiana]
MQFLLCFCRQWLLEGILELNSLSMKFHCCSNILHYNADRYPPLKAVKVTHTVALRTEATVNGGDQPSNLCQPFKNHTSEMFGVCPIYMKFSDDAERTFAAEALSYLQKPGMVKRMVSKLLWYRVGCTSDVEQAGPSKAHSREIGPDLVKPNPFISVSDHHPCLQPWATQRHRSRVQRVTDRLQS